MKLAPVTAVLAAVIGISAIASPVLAQDYGYQSQAGYACQQTKHQSQATGGILGALAGAVIGSNLAAHGGGRTGGALLGAAAGAAIGSNIGVSSARDSGACGATASYGYAQPVYGYVQPAYGYERVDYRYVDYPRGSDHRRYDHRDHDGYYNR